MGKLVFYRSKDGYTADVIPFYEKGKFHLFYLKDYRNSEVYGEGTPWFHLETSNFVDYIESGEALKRGTENEQDLYVFTGCVIKVDETYHIFYTGHNPHFRNDGKNEQGVMHATSIDLVSWTKYPQDTFYAPLNYEPHDWRDPFVFYNEEEKRYWMLLAARSKTGPLTRRGLTAKCVSNDLKNWIVEDPLWEPNYHFTHECPDLFYLNNHYYLIYSEFTDQRLTRYRMATSLEGPWISPKNDSFDGRAYYAAKSVSDGNHRYLFGWVPTKHRNDDNEPWQWGGNLLVHEIYQLQNGELAQKAPQSIKDYFSSKVLYDMDTLIVCATGKCTFNRINLDLPSKYHFHSEIIFDNDVTRVGIALRHNEELDKSYLYLLDGSKQAFTFDLFPNEPWKYANFVGVSRPLNVTSYTTYILDVYVEDDVCCAYINDQLALSSRMYNNKGYPISLVAFDGKAIYKNIKVTTPME